MLDVNTIKKILPHRYPFLLVDRVESVKENEELVAFKNITVNEEVFQGHFPSDPIYPGVLIVEGLAQAGGILAYKSLFHDDYSNDVGVYFMTIDKTKFRNPVRPGDKLVYKVSVIKSKGKVWVIKGEAFVEDTLVAESELKAMVTVKEKK